MRFTQETSWTSVSDIGLARSLSFSSIPPAAAALLYGGWILCLYFVGICKFLKFYHSWCFSPYQFGCVKKFRSNRVFTHTGWSSLVLNYLLNIHICIDIWIGIIDLCKDIRISIGNIFKNVFWNIMLILVTSHSLQPYHTFTLGIISEWIASKLKWIGS